MIIARAQYSERATRHLAAFSYVPCPSIQRTSDDAGNACGERLQELDLASTLQLSGQAGPRSSTRSEARVLLERAQDDVPDLLDLRVGAGECADEVGAGHDPDERTVTSARGWVPSSVIRRAARQRCAGP